MSDEMPHVLLTLSADSDELNDGVGELQTAVDLDPRGCPNDHQLILEHASIPNVLSAGFQSVYQLFPEGR